MENLEKTFTAVYERFRKNPFEFTAFAVLMIGVYFIYANVDKLMELIPTPEYESSQFQSSLKRDALINQSLEDARTFYGADGIVIGQFHNGQYDLTRLPFTKVSITYYEGDLEGDGLGSIYDERPISSMNNIMLNMWKDKEKPECISKKVADLQDPAYRVRMSAIGVTYITLCPLTNIRNYPIGYISTGFVQEPNEEAVEIILNYQRNLATRIAGYLQEGVVRENRD